MRNKQKNLIGERLLWGYPKENMKFKSLLTEVWCLVYLRLALSVRYNCGGDESLSYTQPPPKTLLC